MTPDPGRRSRALVRLIGGSALYAAAVLVGRAALPEGATFSTVWPAAGVGALWLLSTRGRAEAAATLAALAPVTALANLVTGSGLEAALAFAVVNVVHAAAVVAVLRRAGWDGPRPVAALRDLGSLLTAALLGSAASAATAAVLVDRASTLGGLETGTYLTSRNAVSTLVVAAAVLCLPELRDRRLPVRGPAGGLERWAGAVFAVGATAFVLLSAAPLAFLVLPLTLWAAVRAGVAVTTLVVLGQAVLVLLGSAVHDPLPETPALPQALLAQAFLAVLAVTGLVLALVGREREQARQDSAEASESLQRHVDAALVGQATLVLDSGGRAVVVTANPALCRLLDTSARALRGAELACLVDAEQRDHLRRGLDDLAQGRAQGWHGELRLPRRHGVVWVEAALGLVAAAADGRVRVTGQFLDVTARRLAEQRLSHLALHDELTGLPNRALWRDRAEQALARAHRDGTGVGVLYLDLDHFKDVNDEHGHEVGDLLIVEVARRLQAAVRPSDTVARMGGDEFVVVCPGLSGQDDLTEAGRRLLACVGPLVEVDGRPLRITVSIGAAVSSAGTASPDALLRRADSALLASKQQGRARLQVFADEDAAGTAVLSQVLEELRCGLARDEVRVHYQPVVDLGSGRAVGVEALVRWEHPQQGLLLPSSWLDVLEHSDLVHGFGLRVLEQACRDVAGLDGAHGPLALHVNVSAGELDRAGLVEGVRHALLGSGLPPERLTLELTETRMLTVHSSLLRDLQAVRELGVRLAVDDFGTGYSALAHLVQMPVDVLKLDRSFVAALGRQVSAAAVGRGVIAMAGELGIDCVAEGVETQQQADLLRGMGYRLGQGWLYAPALPLEDLRAWLRLPSVPAQRTADGPAVLPAG